MFDLHSGPPPATRTEAKALGLSAFCCAVACPKCQNQWRRVSTGRCVGYQEKTREKAAEARKKAQRKATAPKRAAANRKRNEALRLKGAQAEQRKAEREALREAARKARRKAERQEGKVTAATLPPAPEPEALGDPRDLESAAAPWD